MPDRRRSPQRSDNPIRVALAIAIVVGGLFSAYHYYRSHRSSHEANVVRLAYSPDGAFLYSLDESGVLKKWNASHHFEVRRWLLPDSADVSALLVSDDGATLVALHGNELRSWGLSASADAVAGAVLPDVVAVARIDGAQLVAVRAHEVSLRAYADIANAKGTKSLSATALSAAPCGERRIVVGTQDSKLHFYVVTSGLARLVLERGGHLRVGLEDYAGPRTPRNEELVREAVALVREVRRPVAGCVEAAATLGLAAIVPRRGR